MKKTTLIVGGGVAGLAAAAELARNGIPVTVLEAKDRFGGRIHTIRDGRFPVELGAEFLHGRSRPLAEAIEAADLTTQALPEKNRIFRDGQLREMPLWEAVGNLFHRINWRERDCSLDDFLAAQQDGEPGKTLARHFVQGFDAAHPERISAHGLLRAQYAAEHMSSMEQFRLVEGYSALVEFLERQIVERGGTLMKNAAVKRVHWRKQHVTISVRHDNREKKLMAGAAIIALPLGVLKANVVEFEPPLPDKPAAAREMEFGNVIKIIFHFREPFWDDFGFIHAFDEAIPTWWSDPRGPVLTGWAGGPKAEALLNSSKSRLETLGLEILGRIFPDHAAMLREQLVGSHYHNWTADPHIRGAYSYIPVDGLDVPRRLAAPVADTLFFAGEATIFDAQTGTVFGAYETGLRAAREILKRNQVHFASDAGIVAH